LKTGPSSFANGGPLTKHLFADGLQRRRAPTTCDKGVFITSPVRPHFLFSLIIMFSGIIEEFATVVAIRKDRENIDFTLTCSFVNELSIDQSVAHNGVCLTVVNIVPAQGENPATYTVTAMKETLDRSNLGLLKVGDKVNVERSMLMNGRLDGHIVQGHVDQTATCIAMEDADGSTYFTFQYPFDAEMAHHGYFTVDKGSVTVNGVSLTVCRPTSDTFQVAIIPYTFEHTNFCDIRVGTVVNIEFDIIGKYIARLQQF
jgi:riboflavin synthase